MIEMFKCLPYYEADTGYEGGEGEEVQELAEPVDEEGVEEQEAAEPVESKSDSAFAEMRRNFESSQREIEELRRQLEEANSRTQEYDDTLGLFFDGDNKIAKAKAHYEDVPVEKIIADMEAKRQEASMKSEMESLKAENDHYKFESLKAMDLSAIREKYPDAPIKDVQELGDLFFQARTLGMTAEDAYTFCQQKKGIPPKPIGKVQVDSPKKDYLTRDEVMSMSREERLKNADLIEKSQSRW